MKPPSIVLLDADELYLLKITMHNTLLRIKWLFNMYGMRKNEGRNVLVKDYILSNASFPSLNSLHNKF